MCCTLGQPRNLLRENWFPWLVLEVMASRMPEEAYSSDVLVACGGNDPDSGLQYSVALDSGCADRGTLSAIPGD